MNSTSPSFPSPLAAAALALDAADGDPQRVYTTLVALLDLLLAPSSSSHSIDASLSAGPSLAHTVELLQRLTNESSGAHRDDHHHHHQEEEIVWVLCRIVATWARQSTRFKHQAGRVRFWVTLQHARGVFPESPRVLESSLDATAALFQQVELHQLLAAHRQKENNTLLDELLQLLDRSHHPILPRMELLCPHYDFTNILELALRVLTLIFSSPRVVSTLDTGKDNCYARAVLTRLVPLLTTHFLHSPSPSTDAIHTWLLMARLLLQHTPTLAIQILFLTPSSSPLSWCQQLVHKWHDDPHVMYDFSALFTHILAVPPIKQQPQPQTSGLMATSLVHTHGLLEILSDLLEQSTTRLRAASASAASSSAASEAETLRAQVLELVRAIRMASCFPDMLALFPSIPKVKKVLLPVVLQQLHDTGRDLVSVPQRDNQRIVHWWYQLLLELLLTIDRLALGCPAFWKPIQISCCATNDNSLFGKRILSPLLKMLAAPSPSSTGSSSSHDDDDRVPKDSEIQFVLHRQIQNTQQTLLQLQSSSSNSSSSSLSSRGGTRASPSIASKRHSITASSSSPSSSLRLLSTAATTSRSCTISTTPMRTSSSSSSSTLTVRRSPSSTTISSSSSSSSSLSRSRR